MTTTTKNKILPFEILALQEASKAGGRFTTNEHLASIRRFLEQEGVPEEPITKLLSIPGIVNTSGMRQALGKKYFGQKEKLSGGDGKRSKAPSLTAAQMQEYGIDIS